MDLKNKTAIITGAGRGIGKDIAMRLAEEGCKVVLVSRTGKQLLKVKKDIEDSGGTALVLPVDISKDGSIPDIIDKTAKAFGSIDILVNNAAVLYASDILDVSEEEWDRTMDINLKSAFFLSQKALEVMIDQKSGHIINISSTAALEVPPGIAVYGISKLAMTGLTQAMYETGKEHGVKVSAVYPGMTDTEMLRGFDPPVDPDKWMKPEDISDCIVFLLKQSDRMVVKEIIPWARRHDKI
jgi:NAD(P)-dependent dehydrogenase (short-subunit alcohol dehydrogenase family)